MRVEPQLAFEHTSLNIDFLRDEKSHTLYAKLDLYQDLNFNLIYESLISKIATEVRKEYRKNRKLFEEIDPELTFKNSVKVAVVVGDGFAFEYKKLFDENIFWYSNPAVTVYRLDKISAVSSEFVITNRNSALFIAEFEINKLERIWKKHKLRKLF